MRILTAFAIPALLALCTPALAAWTPAGDTLCTGLSPYASRQMELYPDGSGGILAGTHIYPGYYEEHVIVSRVGADGTIAYTTSGTQVFVRSICPDDQGGAYVGATYLEHVLPEGGLDPDFPYGGLRVYDPNSGLGTVQGTSVAPDDSGGVYATYVIGTNTQGSQRVVGWRVLGDATFAPGWPPEGLVIRDAADYQIDPSVTTIPDGANGLLVGFMYADEGANNTLLYSMRAYRMGSTGSQLWSRLATTERSTGGAVLQLLRSGDHVFYCWDNDSLVNGYLLGQTEHLQSLSLANGVTTPGWPAKGLIVIQANPGDHDVQSFRDSLLLKLLDDGAGGVYVAWNQDALPRAVRVTPTGTLASGWPPEGLPLLDPGAVLANAGPSVHPHAPYAVASSTAGLVTCWSDDRLPGVTLARARWLLPDGTVDPAQPDTGRIVAPSTNALVIGAMSDGDRGVYVGWYEPKRPQDYVLNYYILSWVPYAGPLAVPPTRGPAAPSLTVWPNPARDVMSVQFSPLDRSPARVELIDVAGHRVRTIESSGAIGRFERLDGLPSGVYFVRLTRAGVTRTTRVAIVH
jgi:Secretion system C-terminal sorting domain